MSDQNITLGVALRNLNAFSLDSFEDRLLIQKIYLAQSLGVDLGYNYGWYLKGPYSTELTADVYEVIPKGLDELCSYDFNEKTKKILGEVTDLMYNSKKEEAGLNTTDWYELLASIHYLKIQRGYEEYELLKEKLIEEKPKYSEKQFDLGLEVLEERLNMV